MRKKNFFTSGISITKAPDLRYAETVQRNHRVTSDVVALPNVSRI